MVVLGLVTTVCLGAEMQRYSDIEFNLGPVAPTDDLRNMVRSHLVRRCCAELDALAEKRDAAFERGQWESWRAQVRQEVARDLGPLEFGQDATALNVRVVSRHERAHYVIENVLFESLPGWDVNASVYLPKDAAYPPPWPAIVVPVGHSGKQMKSYQVPAQVFARSGYVAITFDPPGMAGEKQGGNDHFNDGVRCYLTGWSSNRYFVADALRCIDYLATRDDVDMGHGLGMTGVSGGGATTMIATLLDDRIRASGPSCTAVPLALHPVLDVYAPCAETLATGRITEYDDTDVLAAAMPTPVLLMAGAEDEVFKGAWSDDIAAAVGQAFEQAGQGERFRYFADPGGHAYTVAMARAFVTWMDRWVRGTPERELPTWPDTDFEMVPHDLLKCAPRLDGDMYTLNQARAVALRTARAGAPVREAAARLAHVTLPVAAPEARSGGRTLSWFHWVEELMLEPEADIELPATLLYPARQGWRGGGLLYFDDRGRWEELRRQGFLAQTAGFLDEQGNGPALLTVDLRGWGDSRPADTPYDLAGWADRPRWITFVSAALGDPILGMRIRDGLAALAYLRARPEVDPGKVVVGGRGLGAVVALHVAAIDGSAAGVFSLEGLAAFEDLATAAAYSWSHEAFLADVLLHYDLPALVASLPIPVAVVNPLGARRQALDEATAAALYPPREGLAVKAAVDGGVARSFLEDFVRRLTTGP